MILPGLRYQTVGAVCYLDPRKILGEDFVLPNDWNSSFLLQFPAHDTVIVVKVLRKNAWDPESIARTLSSLEPDKTYDLIDVGANIGLFTIQMMLCLRATQRSSAIDQILALEPVSLMYRIARSNLAAVGIDPEVMCERALGRKRESREIFLDAGNGGNNSLLRDQVPNQLSETYTVRVDTLDGVLRERGMRIENDIVLKVDVQGFEADVILGMSEALWSKVSILALEISPGALVAMTSHEIELLFARLSVFKVLEVFVDATDEVGSEVRRVTLAELKGMSTHRGADYFNVVARRR